MRFVYASPRVYTHQQQPQQECNYADDGFGSPASVYMKIPYQRRMSASEYVKRLYSGHHHHHMFGTGAGEDTSSMSSVDSGDSLRSDSLCSRNQPKRSRHLLLREIRRLRAENSSLRSSVDMLKEDLRIERESRQIADACHQKYLEESAEQQAKLELDIADMQDIIDDLRDRLQYAGGHPPSPAEPVSSKLARLNFDNVNDNADDNDDDEEPALYQSPSEILPFEHHIGYPRSSSREENENSENDDDDDEDDEQTISDDEQFEQLARSYLRQAMVSKLTSARANLELDDLMLKYDPSPSTLLRTLADAFIVWINDVIAAAPGSLTTSEIIKSKVQEGFLQFWKAILAQHVQDDQDQYQFLNEAERTLNRHGVKSASALINNFHWLLVMLYRFDIVDGDAISSWWHNSKTGTEPVAVSLRTVTRKFVEWMDSEEEEGNNDGDDDDDVVGPDESDNDTVIEQDDDDIDNEDVFPEESKVVDQMLLDDQNYCICQFDEINCNNLLPLPSNTITTTTTTTTTASTTTTTANTITPTAHNDTRAPVLQERHCTCKITPTSSQTATDTKPKKSVRILL